MPATIKKEKWVYVTRELITEPRCITETSPVKASRETRDKPRVLSAISISMACLRSNVEREPGENLNENPGKQAFAPLRQIPLLLRVTQRNVSRGERVSTRIADTVRFREVHELQNGRFQFSCELSNLPSIIRTPQSLYAFTFIRTHTRTTYRRNGSRDLGISLYINKPTRRVLTSPLNGEISEIGQVAEPKWLAARQTLRVYTRVDICLIQRSGWMYVGLTLRKFTGCVSQV